MKNIKTYEGFFDFFKKKNYDPISIRQILDCLLPLTDVEKIKSDLTDNTTDGIFNSYETVTGGKNYIYYPKKFTDNGFYFVSCDKGETNWDNRETQEQAPNIFFFHMQYSPVEVRGNLIGVEFRAISDDEVNSIMKECQETLEGFDCQMTFFIGRGSNEGRTWDKEFSDINKMVEKTVKRMEYGKDCIRNITVKIKALGGIEE